MKLTLLAGIACLTIPITTASATVIASDDFSGGDSSWSAGPSGTSGETISVTDDSSGIGTGNALNVAISTTGTRTVVLPFSATSIPDGSTLTISFDVRFTGTIPTTDRLFRFGVYDNPSSPFSAADNTGTGFTARVDTGTGATPYADIFDSNGVFNTASANGSVSQGSSTNANFTLSDTTPRLVTLSLANSGGSITSTLTEQYNLGSSPSTVTLKGSTDATPHTTSFNELVIGMNSGTGAGSEEFLIDNVNVSVNPTPVPEPASLGLLGVGALAMLRRRRGI